MFIPQEAKFLTNALFELFGSMFYFQNEVLK